MANSSLFLELFFCFQCVVSLKVTSALTHNISGTAKAAFQTVMAVIIWAEIKTFFWWISNIVVLVGSGFYTYFQKQVYYIKLLINNKYFL